MTSQAMDLYCAVDIMGGTAVRLTQGDFERRTEHGDPLELALRYVSEGAMLLHVVDLDAARGGLPVNRKAVLRIVREVPVPVQVGGGARGREDAAVLLDSGVARVVMSTTAVEAPQVVDELAGRYPGQIVLGLDHRSDSVAVRGWEHASSLTVEQLLGRFDDTPLGAVVVTSIARDGMLVGPDMSALESVLELSSHPVVASGGVRSAADLAELAAFSVKRPDGEVRHFSGAVVGRALVNGSLDVKEALAACDRSG